MSSPLSFVTASSRLVSVTVDDQFGDPVTGLIPAYSPINGSWHLGSPFEDCLPACNIGPSMMDLTLIYNKTWLNAMHFTPKSLATPTITVHFTGSAVYVFNILPNTVPNTHTSADISFSIDGEDVGRFARPPDSSTTFLYNQLVYHNTILDHGPHTLIITAADGSLILFDYLIYTTQIDDATPSSAIPTSTTTLSGSSRSSSSTPTSVGSIVGAVLGGTSLLGFAVGAFLIHRRRTRLADTGTGVHMAMGSSGRGDQHHDVSGFLPATPAPGPLADPVSLDGATTYNLPGLVSNAQASIHASLATADEPPLAAELSSKRCAEITQRLEALQHTRSILSSQTASRSTQPGVNTEGRTEGASRIQELEAEMAQLRGALTALNARLASGHYGHLEPLPECGLG